MNLEWIADTNGEIKVFVSPLTEFIFGREEFLDRIFSQVRQVPSIVDIACFRAFKPEAKIEAKDKIIEIKPEACASREAEFAVKITKLKLCRVVRSIGFGVFNIPDIAGISKERTSKRECIGDYTRYVVAVFYIPFQLHIAGATVKLV